MDKQYLKKARKKMKLIIDISEEQYNDIVKHLTDNDGNYAYSDFNLREIIRNGTPIDKGDLIMYNLLMTTIADKGLPFEEVLLLIDNAKTPTEGDCISREALKNELNSRLFPQDYSTTLLLGVFNELIDNAPTVEPERPQCNQIAWEQGYEAGLVQGKKERPQGDLISRDALKEAISTADKFACSPDTRLVPFYELPYAEEDYVPYVHLEDIVKAIDNAQTVAVNCKDCDGYEAGYSAGLKDAERPQGEWRDNLIEVFRQSAEVGGDTFHLFEIERIINGEPI